MGKQALGEALKDAFEETRVGRAKTRVVEVVAAWAGECGAMGDGCLSRSLLAINFKSSLLRPSSWK